MLDPQPGGELAGAGELRRAFLVRQGDRRRQLRVGFRFRATTEPIAGQSVGYGVRALSSW
ncbi:MAG: hypothetical protein U0736_16400 [Gemmataceae bacterium]